MAEEYISVSEFRDYVERMTGTKNIGYGLEIYFEGFRLTGFEQALANAPRADVVSRKEFEDVCKQASDADDRYAKAMVKIEELLKENAELYNRLSELGKENKNDQETI